MSRHMIVAVLAYCAHHGRTTTPFGVADNAMAASLNVLVHDGLLAKKIDLGVPLYSITDKGRTAMETMIGAATAGCVHKATLGAETKPISSPATRLKDQPAKGVRAVLVDWSYRDKRVSGKLVTPIGDARPDDRWTVGDVVALERIGTALLLTSSDGHYLLV